MNGSEARCFCGQVILHFAAKKPFSQLECGCCDCRQKSQWASTQPNSKVPKHTKQFSNLVYFDSEIVDVEIKGEGKRTDFLEVCLLREGGLSKFLVTKCCCSVLGVDNPFYHPEAIPGSRFNFDCVMVPLDGCVVETSEPIPDAIAQLFLKDLFPANEAEKHKEEIEKLKQQLDEVNSKIENPDRKKLLLFFDERDDQSLLPSFMDAWRTIKSREKEKEEREKEGLKVFSLIDIFDTLGPVRVLDLKEGLRM
eukprot:CAMPEP_0201491926 /NCGR_PEP_ID=MMETSP0151_2-20130828/31810_1 /ASSEMBLY_ACC=CAM_ASM_000257 /TAXON_ID=200890 /ORGANISM="Paramoeba atlantica, Strain 621/1 / CCAP 1560/9" /LENGTH=251 /DNA_ID=CAMNT_0047878535 /DNA_START=34 /DNA_END=789 /DNA_ORIENTATION=-